MNEMYEYVQSIFEPHPVYLVGGSVRDHILGLPAKDYDFCIKLHPDEIETLVRKAGRRAYGTGKRFGTIGFKTPDGAYFIEVTSTRGEVYTEGSRHPVTAYGVELSEDLSRRDFTMNALAYRAGKIIDQHGGKEDIEHGVIRAVGSATTRFKEDPLRMLRAARFSAQFGFDMEEATYKSAKRNAHKILHVSKERWVQELDKVLMSPYPEQGLGFVMGMGLMTYILPEVAIQYGYDQNSKYHDYQLWVHTLLVVKDSPHDIDLRWAALLHDVAKPFCRVNKEGRSVYAKHDLLGAEMVDHIARRLRFSNERREAVVQLVLTHLDDANPLREADNKHKKGKP
jgi:putative nucleotidyltransferase with HDIG domain